MQGGGHCPQAKIQACSGVTSDEWGLWVLLPLWLGSPLYPGIRKKQHGPSPSVQAAAAPSHPVASPQVSWFRRHEVGHEVGHEVEREVSVWT